MEGINGISASSVNYQNKTVIKNEDGPEKKENIVTDTTISENGKVFATEDNDSEKKKSDYVTVSDAEREKALNILKSQLKDTKLQISYNDDVNRFSISVIDGQTDKVIKEIPSEDSLKLLEHNMELAGLLVDEKR